MNRVLRIAAAELLLLTRSRAAWLGLAAIVLLSVVAAATAFAHAERERVARETQQAAADRAFAAQPDRHPHRVVHYGHFAHRPVSPLAAFDPGVDPFTGTVIFLEGHRQNTAAFGAVRESSDLIRFGRPTPAFVLQTLAPLLLVFLGFSMVSRERENGGLRQLRLHGARGWEILAGKSLALGAAALAALAPALIALAAAAVRAPAETPAALALAGAYALYLGLWTVAIVAVSALLRSGRAALVALTAVWTVSAVLVPRAAATLAGQAEPLPGRAWTELAVQRDLRAVGDSHNPDDPFFSEFRRRTLERYGVERVEDLPVNYRGLVSAEGEALTSRLFDEYAERTATVQRAQSARLDAAALFSPTLAVRRVSMTGAGTDLENHLRFLAQAEAHRFDFVQRLNRLHAEAVAAEDDAARSRDPEAERRTRVSANHFAAMPDFVYRPATAAERVGASLPALGVLALWLAAAAGLFVVAARRVEREDGR